MNGSTTTNVVFRFSKNTNICRSVIKDAYENNFFERMVLLAEKTFSIIGCQHAHISIFIEEMIALGYKCAGIYESENKELLHEMAKKYELTIVEDMESL